MSADDDQARLLAPPQSDTSGVQAPPVASDGAAITLRLTCERIAAALRPPMPTPWREPQDIPDWARGRFPFCVPTPTLKSQQMRIEQMLAPLSDRRAKALQTLPPEFETSPRRKATP